MEKQFCAAILKNDKAALKIILDKKFDTIDIKDNQMENFESIKNWLEEFNCVSSVEIVPGMIRTKPPIKVFDVYVKSPDDVIKVVQIKLQVLPDKLSYNPK
ncbi:hypothetical protein [Saccharicrinis carchari]|nr:hypothetical protein [Saccharicrinis carchari]